MLISASDSYSGVFDFPEISVLAKMCVTHLINLEEGRSLLPPPPPPLQQNKSVGLKGDMLHTCVSNKW